MVRDNGLREGPRNSDTLGISTIFRAVNATG
jgi:hypothetical protein